MIRVALLANTLVAARNLAELLGEDERLEIVELQTVSGNREFSRRNTVDVLVTIGLLLDRIPSDGPPVVALTDEPLVEMPFRQALRAILPLHSSAAEIGAAIVAGASELIVMTQSQARKWLGVPRSAHFNDDFGIETLTARELQVLRMLADGLANKQIADDLKISEHTAKFHVAQILSKLRAASRAEAVAIGMRRGLVPV